MSCERLAAEWISCKFDTLGGATASTVLAMPRAMEILHDDGVSNTNNIPGGRVNTDE